MGWKVEFEPRAFAELGKLDRVAQKRIVRFFQERVAGVSDPRQQGKALTGEKAGFWRYRVGDYRAVCFLDDDRQIVKVMRVAHRKDVYR
ncbi:MAG: type II toxin-antitoxin system RelE/ParE family toxin [Candidatus Sulfotelmatobacter sp.]